MRHAAAFLCLVTFLAGANAALIGSGSAEARGRSASRKATIQKQRQKNREKAALRRARRKAKSSARQRGPAEGSLPRPRAAERTGESNGRATARVVEPSSRILATGLRSELSGSVARSSDPPTVAAMIERSNARAAGRRAAKPTRSSDPPTVAAMIERSNARAAGRRAAKPTRSSDPPTVAAMIERSNARAAGLSQAEIGPTSSSGSRTSRSRTSRSRTSRSRTSRSRTYNRRSALIPASHEKVAVERSSGRPRALAAAGGPDGRSEPTTTARTADCETVATRFIRRQLRKSGKATWDLATPVFQYAGDSTNPVTGTGPIEVVARQKRQPTGLWGRITRALNPNSERRFMVVIDARGTPQVLSEEANSLPYRLMRKFGERVPLKEIVSDAIRSQGVRNGLGLSAGGLAIGATGGPFGWAAAGALIYRGAKLAIDGVDRRRVARESAMDKTVTDIKSDIKNGETVTLAEAYRTYKVNLDNTKPGTTPLSLRKFTAELSTHGL